MEIHSYVLNQNNTKQVQWCQQGTYKLIIFYLYTFMKNSFLNANAKIA